MAMDDRIFFLASPATPPKIPVHQTQAETRLRTLGSN